MADDIFEFSSAIISLILIAIYVIIGITICSKYFKGKQRVFLSMGLGWILLSFIWLSFVINNFMILIDPNSWGLTVELIFIISGVPMGIAPLLIANAFTMISFEKNRRYILAFAISISLIYEICCVIFLFTNPDLIGTKTVPLIFKNSLFSVLFVILFILMMVSVGIVFSYHSMKSEDPLVKIRGKLIFIALILFAVGAFLDSVRMGLILDLVDGIILIFCVVIFYFGFIMPDWLKTRYS